MLENIGKVTAVALDKTGTLTAGKPQVTDVVGASAATRARCCASPPALETGSSHPLAQAILARAAADGVEPAPAADGKALGGKGVTGTRRRRRGRSSARPRRPAPGCRSTRITQARIEALNHEGKTVSVLVVGGELAGPHRHARRAAPGREGRLCRP